MNLPVLAEGQDPESLCRRCGASCHMAIEVGDRKYIIEELHCRFLGRDADNHHYCTVYENRFERAPWCQTAVVAAQAGHLAQDCLYAAGIENYHGKQWAPPDIRRKLLPIVRAQLIGKGLPLAESPDAALRILNDKGALDRWAYREEQDRFVFYRIEFALG